MLDRVFHAPFLEFTQRFEVVAIWGVKGAENGAGCSEEDAINPAFQIPGESVWIGAGQASYHRRQGIEFASQRRLIGLAGCI